MAHRCEAVPDYRHGAGVLEDLQACGMNMPWQMFKQADPGHECSTHMQHICMQRTAGLLGALTACTSLGMLVSMLRLQLCVFAAAAPVAQMAAHLARHMVRKDFLAAAERGQERPKTPHTQNGLPVGGTLHAQVAQHSSCQLCHNLMRVLS